MRGFKCGTVEIWDQFQQVFKFMNGSSLGVDSAVSAAAHCTIQRENEPFSLIKNHITSILQNRNALGNHGGLSLLCL